MEIEPLVESQVCLKLEKLSTRPFFDSPSRRIKMKVAGKLYLFDTSA
jgi:hypothetical protein